MTFYVWQQVTMKKMNVGSWKAEEDIALPQTPEFGVVYTIASLETFGGELWLLFAEIPGPYNFEASSFRPVVKPKLEVSFTMGAPLDSERWDNRRKQPARTD